MLPYLRESPDRAQQPGAVANGGGSVSERGGELGRLTVIRVRVHGRLVLDG